MVTNTSTLSIGQSNQHTKPAHTPELRNTQMSPKERDERQQARADKLAKEEMGNNGEDNPNLSLIPGFAPEQVAAIQAMIHVNVKSAIEATMGNLSLSPPPPKDKGKEKDDSHKKLKERNK